MKNFAVRSLVPALGIAFLAGCATESDLSEQAFAEHYAVGSESHPKGARLSRNQAIRLGSRAFERLGFPSDDLGNPGALYIGPERGMFGARHRDWIVSFANKGASAARYPGLTVYVDDRNGETDIIEKGAKP